MSTVQYQQLLQKVKAVTDRQDVVYTEQMVCKAGCDACCRPPASFFLPEADILEKAIQTLPHDEKQAIHERLASYQGLPDEKCPLLKNKQCTVYEARPLICRSHGYALWHSDESSFSWCDLNFLAEAPTREYALDIERTNAMLSLITQLGWPKQEGRRALVEIISSGLSS